MAQSRIQTQNMAQAKATSEAAVPSTPAAAATLSARVLKKRETDRRCQRMIRERTKSRIAYLEGLVEQFRSQDSSGRVETLMRQLAEMKEERDVLAKKVQSIQSIVAGTFNPEDLEVRNMPAAEADREKPQFSQREKPSSEGSDKHTDSDESPPKPSDGPTYQLYNKEFAEYQRGSLRPESHVPCSPNVACECCDMSSHPDGRKINKWLYANDTLTAWFKWSPDVQDINIPQEVNDDVPIRAVVEGWDVVEQQQNTHPSWLLLKGIDQNIFATCDEKERLAILIVMGLLIQAHLNPTRDQTAKLPSFYLKRPSQEMLGTYATEYFAWPGLRERFLVNEHRYCSNTFWKTLCKSFKVMWPFEFRDCYTRNTETGLYQLSPTFHETLHDIRAWTMGNEMFQIYPELYTDIPAWNSIPGGVSTSPLPLSRWRALPPAQPGSRSRSVDSAKPGYDLQQQRQNEKEEAHSDSQSAGGFEQPDQPLYSDEAIYLFSQTAALNNLVTATQPSTEPYWGDWSSNFSVDSLPMDVI